jgi:hypothetical protein
MTTGTGQHLRHRLTWTGEELAALERPPPALPAEVRWDALTRFDRLALGAAYALDGQTDGALRANGARTAAVIQSSWTSLDGTVRYLERAGARYGGMARDFAQMGGTSTCHYLAVCLGIKGYATLMFEDVAGDEASGVIDDVARMAHIDQVCHLDIRLRWDVANRLLNVLGPAGDLVRVSLSRPTTPEAD